MVCAGNSPACRPAGWLQVAGQGRRLLLRSGTIAEACILILAKPRHKVGLWRMGKRMKTCDHPKLVLLTAMDDRLRCRHCHLTIRADELNSAYCPECFERNGKKHADFEPLAAPAATRYRCEDCGAIIEYVPRRG